MSQELKQPRTKKARFNVSARVKSPDVLYAEPIINTALHSMTNSTNEKAARKQGATCTNKFATVTAARKQHQAVESELTFAESPDIKVNVFNRRIQRLQQRYQLRHRI